MNFVWDHGLISISIKIIYDEKQVEVDKCILDTGSATTALDINLVDFNYNKPTSIKRLFGIGGGSQEVVVQTTDKLIIDEKGLSNIKIEFGDIHSELGINGFIGNDILKQFTISIDYSNQNVRFIEHAEPFAGD